jgi:hypothetical protein
MVYPVQAPSFSSLMAFKNVQVTMPMLIFLCLVREKNYFGLTETPHLDLTLAETH